jgi:hypothetical protein
MFLASCGESSENASEEASSEEVDVSGDKSFCDCMDIASNNSEIEEAPEGCEWIDALSEKDAEDALKNALNDCPDNLPEGMVDMMEELDELVDITDDLEDISSDVEDDLDDMGGE